MSNDANLWWICCLLFALLLLMSMCNTAIPPSTRKICDEMGGMMQNSPDGKFDLCILRVTE